jgi:hypothetical protein
LCPRRQKCSSSSAGVHPLYHAAWLRARGSRGLWLVPKPVSIERRIPVLKRAIRGTSPDAHRVSTWPSSVVSGLTNHSNRDTVPPTCGGPTLSSAGQVPTNFAHGRLHRQRSHARSWSARYGWVPCHAGFLLHSWFAVVLHSNRLPGKQCVAGREVAPTDSTCV